MACLKGGVVANVVVPTPDYIRLAAHYPDFCHAQDPESKGIVENLVGYAQRDLVVPLLTEADGRPVSVEAANVAAAGNTRLAPELEVLLALAAAHGTDALIAALGRAVAFQRFKAAAVRSILAAGTAAPTPVPAGGALVLDLPVAATRSLADYNLAALTGTAPAEIIDTTTGATS